MGLAVSSRGIVYSYCYRLTIPDPLEVRWPTYLTFQTPIARINALPGAQHVANCAVHVACWKCSKCFFLYRSSQWEWFVAALWSGEEASSTMQLLNEILPSAMAYHLTVVCIPVLPCRWKYNFLMLPLYTLMPANNTYVGSGSSTTVHKDTCF